LSEVDFGIAILLEDFENTSDRIEKERALSARMAKWPASWTGGLMRWAQHRLPSAPILACFRPFKGTVGARRVESASSKARLVPDVSNPALSALLIGALGS
jgi:hypothetical protein